MILIDDPEYWRARAEQARVVADLFEDSESRDRVLRIAAIFAELGDRADARVRARAETED